jgi:hypothetical protein
MFKQMDGHNWSTLFKLDNASQNGWKTNRVLTHRHSTSFICLVLALRHWMFSTMQRQQLTLVGGSAPQQYTSQKLSRIRHFSANTTPTLQAAVNKAISCEVDTNAQGL